GVQMKKTVYVLILVTTLFVGATAQAADKYWVSFSNELSIYLMQIDSDGTIVVPPTLISSYPPFVTILTALSNAGPGQLTFWALEKQLDVHSLLLQHRTVNTDNLTGSTPGLFPIAPDLIETSLFSLSATQNVPNSFITFQKSTSLKAFGTTDSSGFD